MSVTKTWIQEEPPAGEIALNKNGSQYIPIAIVESLLDEYTEGHWETRNFDYSFCNYGTVFMISASVELTVWVRRNPNEALMISRTITGACTFSDADFAGNLDFVGTALSECIKNAAKKLGARFGKNLNGRGEMRGEVVKDKPMMDVVTAKKYQNAKLAGDVKTISEIENYYNVGAN